MKKTEFFANARQDVSGPLQGIRVIEATTTWAGPMAGCVLADFGATVIKVEHPQGEVIRRLPPMLPDSSLSLPNETVNRNKLSVSLDLRKPDGREIFLKLCSTMDILIENFKPGTLAEWGVGYTDVVKAKPDIIYVSISGFGQFGPLSDRPGYDPVAQNFSGWSSLNGAPDGGPTKAPTFLGDDLGGLHGALGALAALQHRQRTGEGQHVDIALADGVMFQSNGNLSLGALGMTQSLPRFGNQFAIAVPVNVYACSDGHIYGGVLLDSHWKALCTVLERNDLNHLTNLQRIERRAELDGLVAEWCRNKTVVEVDSTFTRLGLAVTRVNTYADAAKTEHVREREMLQMTTLSNGSNIPITGPAAKFSRTPTRVRTPARPLGADNQQVLSELGYSNDQQAQLKQKGVC